MLTSIGKTIYLVFGFVAYLVGTFLSDGGLPTVMLNLGLALVTIFIPVGIFLVQDTHDEMDRVIILKYVLQLERLFTGLCLIFAPVFFWVFSPIRLFLFAIFGLGVWTVVDILFSSYLWLRTLDSGNMFDTANHRNKLRNEYLSEAKDWAEKERIWGQIWQKEARVETAMDERNLIDKFTKNLDSLLASNNSEIYARFLGTFAANMDKRVIYDWPTYGSLLKAALSWYSTLYTKLNASENEDAADNRDYEAEFATTNIIQKLIGSALEKGPAFILFDTLRKHLADKPIEYTERVLRQLVIRQVFDGIQKSPEGYDIWHHYFPPEWKITKASLENTANLVPRIWGNQFFEWAQNRIWNQEKKDFDPELDDLAEELFPEVDPSWWARILIFLFSPWTDGDRMSSLVRAPKPFGFASRVGMATSFTSMEQASADLHKRIENERVSTIDFSLTIFAPHFTEEKLKSYISELESLQLEKGEKEDLVRNEYLEIFRKMLEALNHKKKSKDG